MVSALLEWRRRWSQDQRFSLIREGGGVLGEDVGVLARVGRFANRPYGERGKPGLVSRALGFWST